MLATVETLCWFHLEPLQREELWLQNSLLIKNCSNLLTIGKSAYFMTPQITSLILPVQTIDFWVKRNCLLWIVTGSYGEGERRNIFGITNNSPWATWRTWRGWWDINRKNNVIATGIFFCISEVTWAQVTTWHIGTPAIYLFPESMMIPLAFIFPALMASSHFILVTHSGI